jgi:hypothetical protein
MDTDEAGAAVPQIRYAKTEDGYIAYQIFGRGRQHLMLIGNWASNIEVMWEHPAMARYLNRLGRLPESFALTSGVLAFGSSGHGRSADARALDGRRTHRLGRRWR